MRAVSPSLVTTSFVLSCYSTRQDPLGCSSQRKSEKLLVSAMDGTPFTWSWRADAQHLCHFVLDLLMRFIRSIEAQAPD